MPKITTKKLSLAQIARGSITRGEIETADGHEWSSLSTNEWRDFDELGMTIDIPENTRALLLTSHLTIRTFFNGGYTRTYYMRFNLDDGRWISPEATVTVENLSGSWGEDEHNIEDTGINMYLMKDSHSDWKTGEVKIDVQLQAEQSQDGHDMTSDGVLTAAMLLR